MNIKKELSSDQTMLLIMPGAEYNNVIIDVMKQLQGKKICYVTLNKTYDSLIDAFKKKNINTKDIVFIDAISKTIKKVPEKLKECYFCSSPGALTEISLVIKQFLEYKFDYIIFDSLTNLMIYQKKAPVSRFVSSMINKIKTGGPKAIFYSLSMKDQDDLIREAEMFVDKVVTVGK